MANGTQVQVTFGLVLPIGGLPQLLPAGGIDYMHWHQTEKQGFVSLNIVHTA